LEPCSHYGKTPPCAELIISKGIPHVVIATLEPNPQVSGRGVRMLKEANIKVDSGVLENEAKELNYPFFVNKLYNRPYILLKWAQSKDGFIDKIRNSYSDEKPVRISNDITQIIVHKYRSRIQAILVGTNTVILDNPQLNTRKWYGKNPTRITIDRNGRIPQDSQIFNQEAETIVLTENSQYKTNGLNVKTEIFNINNDQKIREIRRYYDRNDNLIYLESEELSMYSSAMSYVTKYEYY